MPFTPLHMGPGLLIKALLQGAFSLMVFGWTQIVMDLQPLFAMLTHVGKYHGFTHTYLGASLLAVFAALSGKYLSERALEYLSFVDRNRIHIRWHVAVTSAFIGAWSHVLIDSLTHWDMVPLAPFSTANPLLGLVSVDAIHEFCLYSGLAGAAVYVGVGYVLARRHRACDTD